MLTLGTAGHIDHGKTTLTGLLTGQDTDRLPEEKARGISIDLGFARLETAPGHEVGLVDVPGHERFVHNMVAGAAGIGGYLLVVAADEGLMPQTREHLHILRLLGVREGLVVLTKTDLAEPDMVELVEEEVREALQGDELPEAEMVPYSSKDPASVERVRAGLERLRARLTPPDRGGGFRLPVDRIFSLKGHGTVVTGTVFSGRVEVGQELSFRPDGPTSRVRGLQVFGADAKHAPAGSRVALNVPDADRKALRRGMMAVPSAGAQAHSIWNVRVELLRDLPEGLARVETGARVRVHHGTAAVPGRLHLLEGRRLEAGQRVLAQLRLDEPLVAAPDDPFLIRALSPVVTLGGGRVLEVGAPRFKRGAGKAGRLARIEAEGVPGLVAASLAATDRLLLSAEGLAETTMAPLKAVRAALKEAGETFCRRDGAGGPFYGDPARVSRTEGLLLDAVRAFHAAHPVEKGIPRDALGHAEGVALPGAVVDLLLKDLVKEGKVLDSGGRVRLPDHVASYDATTDAGRAKVMDFLEAAETPFQGPHNLGEAAGVTGKATTRLLDNMVKGGDLLRMPGPIYAPRALVDELRGRVLGLCDAAGDEPVTTQQVKQALDLTRKALIPLLEGMDEDGLTLRKGDGRIRRPGTKDAHPGTPP